MAQPRQTEAGIRCRRCGCRHLDVVYTRHRWYGIVRSRRCRYCGYRIITRERLIGQPSSRPAP